MNNELKSLINSFSFYIRKVKTETMPLNWVLNERNILDHELLFVEQGRMLLNIDNKIIPADKNDIILIPPNVVHSFKTENERLIQPHIHFDFFFTKKSYDTFISFGVITPDDEAYSLMDENIYGKIGLPYKLTLDPISAQTVKQLIYDIAELQLSNDISSLFQTKILMLKIFEIIITKNIADTNIDSKENAIFKLINILVERQINTNLDLSLIVKQVGYSINYLSTLYKKHFNMTPAKYHAMLKIQKAKDYLCQHVLTASEIAETLGFNSLSDFSRFFKRHTGISPTCYAKQQQNASKIPSLHE